LTIEDDYEEEDDMAQIKEECLNQVMRELI